MKNWKKKCIVCRRNATHGWKLTCGHSLCIGVLINYGYSYEEM